LKASTVALLVVGVALVAVLFFRAQLTKLFAPMNPAVTGVPQSTNTTTATQSSSGSTVGTGTFPVTVSSNPANIVSAFQQSGYFTALQQEGLTADIQNATNNPVAWLQGHPYLIQAYPTYFG